MVVFTTNNLDDLKTYFAEKLKLHETQIALAITVNPNLRRDAHTEIEATIDTTTEIDTVDLVNGLNDVIDNAGAIAITECTTENQFFTTLCNDCTICTNGVITACGTTTDTVCSPSTDKPTIGVGAIVGIVIGCLVLIGGLVYGVKRYRLRAGGKQGQLYDLML